MKPCVNLCPCGANPLRGDDLICKPCWAAMPHKKRSAYTPFGRQKFRLQKQREVVAWAEGRRVKP